MPPNKGPILVSFTDKIYQTFNELLTPICLKFLQKFQEEGRLRSLLNEASIILIPKPEKDTSMKENYGLISLMNIDVKILNKILAHQIHQCIKKTIHHDQVGLFWGSKVDRKSTNKCDTSHKQNDR